MTDNEIINIADAEPFCEMAVAIDSEGDFIRVKHLIDIINRQKAEIERLQKYNTNVAFKHYNDGKSEGIKEFTERLKEKFIKNTACGAYVRKIIDNLVKEMTNLKEH